MFRPFVLAGNGSTCNQNSHAWVGGVGFDLHPRHDDVPTGVVAAATRIVFDFVNPTTVRSSFATSPSPRAQTAWSITSPRPSIFGTCQPDGSTSTPSSRAEAIEDVRVLVGQFTGVSEGGGGGTAAGVVLRVTSPSSPASREAGATVLATTPRHEPQPDGCVTLNAAAISARPNSPRSGCAS